MPRRGLNALEKEAFRSLERQVSWIRSLKNQLTGGAVVKRCLPLLLALLLLASCTQSEANEFTLKEASGITRQGDYLLIVGDEDPGAYYRFQMFGDVAPIHLIEPWRLTRVELPQANLAIDLESIDILADGRIVVLSERLRTLVGEKGLVAEYDKPLSEFGNIGLEGLAVRGLEDGSSRIAVLWEGGYPDYQDVPGQLQGPAGRLSFRPVVWVHDLKKDEAGVEIKMKNKEKYALREILLDVPRPAGQEPQAQRFRAPDLVWHQWKNDGGGKEQWGFIVLLSSRNSPEQGKPEFVHQWLQRFTIAGKPVGNPLDLNTLVPAHLKGANWEGLGWFEEGKSLVIIYDKYPKDPPVAIVVPVPADWK